MNAAIIVKPVASSNVKPSSSQIIASGLRAAQNEAHFVAYETGYKSFFNGDVNLPVEFANSPLASSWLAGRDEARVDDLELFEVPGDMKARAAMHEQLARHF